jgi:hypothetical protein
MLRDRKAVYHQSQPTKTKIVNGNEHREEATGNGREERPVLVGSSKVDDGVTSTAVDSV